MVEQLFLTVPSGCLRFVIVIFPGHTHLLFMILKLSIFPFLDGYVPRSTSYRVYIFQLIRFTRASSYVADFNTRNKLLTQKLLKQG